MSQPVALRSPTQSATPPPNVPYATKESAKRWLESLKAQGLPLELNERITNLDKRINVKGKPWDELKPDLEALYSDLVRLEQQQRILQQQQLPPLLEVGIPTPVLRDQRVDILVQKYKEMEIAERLRTEITSEMEKTKERIQYDVSDNLRKMQQLKNDLVERDETIANLKTKLSKLEEQKEELENKIRSLDSEIKELKQEVGNLQITISKKDEKIDKLMEMYSKRMDEVTDEAEDMKIQIQELKDRNQELEKMNESRIVVGETMKIMIKAIYKHVHPSLKLRKRTSYNVRDIGDHVYTKYRSDSNGQKAAEDRWEKLKGELDWDEDTEDLIQDLIDKRNQTAHPLKPPTDKIEFRNALRQMKNENDIEDDEEGIAFVLYSQCKRKLNI